MTSLGFAILSRVYLVMPISSGSMLNWHREVYGGTMHDLGLIVLAIILAVVVALSPRYGWRK